MSFGGGCSDGDGGRSYGGDGCHHCVDGYRRSGGDHCHHHGDGGDDGDNGGGGDDSGSGGRSCW